MEGVLTVEGDDGRTARVENSTIIELPPMRPRFLAAAGRVADAILVTTSIALVFVSLLLVRRDWISVRRPASSPWDMLFWAAPTVLALVLLAGLRLTRVRRSS
jgi:hypothetical protein